MMPEDDEMTPEQFDMIRTSEDRIVWMLCHLIQRIRGLTAQDSAISADNSLEHYRGRFPKVPGEP